MLISKFTAKDGTTKVSILVQTDMIKTTKNPQYKRIVLKSDFLIGLDEKKQAKLCEILNIDKLVDNTLTKK